MSPIGGSGPESSKNKIKKKKITDYEKRKSLDLKKSDLEHQF